ncbi:MAG: acetolactate synthase small subunit [Clostridiales bacterium]|jgi:acetolactate synthase-1/3 small subunit|nr:acetolactate synthase small subunit [Clostridiales bacterium]
MEAHLLSVLVENHPGVLFRVAGLFSRRGFNIESLAVGTTQVPAISRMTIIVLGNDHMIDQIVKQLSKLIQVLTIKILPAEAAVSRELILVKVAARPENRHQIVQIADIFRAKIIDVSRESLTIEMTGESDKTAALQEMLSEYGIIEIARTGVIALERGPSSISSASKEAREFKYGKPDGADSGAGE